jgi:membrane protein
VTAFVIAIGWGLETPSSIEQARAQAGGPEATPQERGCNSSAAVNQASAMKPRAAWQFLRDAYHDWVMDDAPRLGAALAYYTLFAIAPLLIIAIAVAGLVFGREAAQARLVSELARVVGTSGAEAISALIENGRKHQTGAVATIIGSATLLIGASGAFLELKGALNRVWDVKETRRGWWRFVGDRLAAFALVLAVGFLLMASLVVSAALSAAGALLQSYASGPLLVLQGINMAISLAVITMLFALIFKLLPDASIAWRDVWVGATMTSALFAVGKAAIGLYLGHSGLTSAYGAAGSVVVLIVWVYYFAQIFYFGAELTQAYARAHGSHRDRVRSHSRSAKVVPP